MFTPTRAVHLGVVVDGFSKLFGSFGNPDDREDHCLNDFALTLSHETTAFGFCSYFATRRSNSVACSSLKAAGAWAAKSSDIASSSSNFSATPMLPMFTGRLFMLSEPRKPLPLLSMVVCFGSQAKVFVLLLLPPSSPDIRSESAPVKVAHLIGPAIAARSGLTA